MSHVIEKTGEELRLYVTGSGAAYITYAEHVGGNDEDDPEGWRIWPYGIAEHLEEFVVENEKQALTVLNAIGLAYEAGGGG